MPLLGLVTHYSLDSLEGEQVLQANEGTQGVGILRGSPLGIISCQCPAVPLAQTPLSVYRQGRRREGGDGEKKTSCSEIGILSSLINFLLFLSTL